MIKTTIFTLIVIFSYLNVYSYDFPVPKNDLLYTEYTFKKTNPYIKKPVIGKGFLILNGKDNLLFKQTEPVIFSVSISKEELTYQSGNNTPIKMNQSSEIEQSPIAVLFTGNIDKIKELFSIQYEKRGTNDFYVLKPLENNLSLKNISNIKLESEYDIVKSILINYNNKTTLLYNFNNTITGEPIDKSWYQ